MMDPTCPPSRAYAAYNPWTGPTEIREYPLTGHEGGGAFHTAEQLPRLAGHTGRDTPGAGGR